MSAMVVQFKRLVESKTRGVVAFNRFSNVIQFCEITTNMASTMTTYVPHYI